MTLPHQCRCVICGEIGTIMPGLPNVFAAPSGDSAYASSRADELASRDPKPYPYDDIATPLPSIGGALLPPVETQHTDNELAAAAVSMVDRAYTSFKYEDVRTCVHGYTRCMPCKFPSP